MLKITVFILGCCFGVLGKCFFSGKESNTGLNQNLQPSTLSHFKQVIRQPLQTEGGQISSICARARARADQFLNSQARLVSSGQFKLAIESQVHLSDKSDLSSLLEQCFAISPKNTLESMLDLRLTNNEIAHSFESLLTKWLDIDFDQSKVWLNEEGKTVGNGTVFRCLLRSTSGNELAAELLSQQPPDAGIVDYVRMAGRVLAERKWGGLNDWIESFPGSKMRDAARAGASQVSN